MPVMFAVPDAARKAALRGISLHISESLPDTAGLPVAEALQEQSVDENVVARMHRFFVTQGAAVRLERAEMLTEESSPLLRSWSLYGGDAGQAFAASLFEAAVLEGADPDPLRALLKQPAAAVESLLSNGSWQFEFGLDVASAGRFAEEYVKTNGATFDLVAAFGASAPAVEQAFNGRLAPHPVFERIAECLDVDGDDYLVAANLDLAEVTNSSPAANLDEALGWATLHTMNAKAAAKIVWAPFVAYFILSVEKPELLKDLNKHNHGVLDITKDPSSWSQYIDVVNTAIMYFHPKGAHYVDPSKDKAFAGIDIQVIDMLRNHALKGLALNRAVVKGMLGKARRWTAQNGFAGSMFHVYNADWNKGNWEHILADIPAHADVRPAFASFAAAKPAPQGGIALQQTLSAQNVKDELLTHLKGDYAVSALEQVKIKDTLTGAAAAAVGTPIGVYSMVNWSVDRVIMGAVKLPTGKVVIVTRTKSGEWGNHQDLTMASAIKSGHCTVTHAHHGMPGTSYAKKAAEPEPEPATPAKTVYVPSLPPSAVKLTKLEAYLTGVFGDVWHQFGPRDVAVTAFGKAWMAQYGKKLVVGDTIKQANNGEHIKIVGCYNIPNLMLPDENGVDHEVADDILVFEHSDGEIAWESDEEIADLVKPTNLVPLDYVAPNAPHVPKFGLMDVVLKGQHYYLVIGVTAKEYLAYPLLVSWNTEFPPISFDHKVFEHDATLTTKAVKPEDERIYLKASTSASKLLPPDPKWPVAGTKIEHGGSTYFLVGGLQAPSLWIQVVVGEMVDEKWMKFSVKPTSILDAVSSSYDPPPSKTIPKFETLVPDVMCGTQEAIDKAAKLGWKMAAKGDHHSFTWDLGDVLQYGPNASKTRTIIGYAFNATGGPIYIIRTETLAINFKDTANGNKDYGPVLTTHQDILNSLKPKPGAAKPAAPPAALPPAPNLQNLPKTPPAPAGLNYTPSDEAKVWAIATKTTFVSAPDDAPLVVNTKLQGGQGGSSMLIGWKSIPGLNKPVAIILNNGKATFVPSSELGAYSPKYAYANEITPHVVTFGKAPGQAGINVSGAGFSTPSAMPEGWDAPPSVTQPPVSGLQGGQHLAAGIVICIPGGALIGSMLVKDPAVVMVHPMNGFGGYKITFPKGTVDKGESIEKAAVRETWEETGLAAKPHHYLGDYKGSTSVTRMFIGTLLGGDPKKAGWETDAVTIRVLVGFSLCALQNDVEKTVLGLPWFAELSDRDRHILIDAAKYLFQQGLKPTPSPVAEYDSQPTLPQDVSGPVYDPKMVTAVKAPKDATHFQASTVDYPVTAATLDYITGYVQMLNKGLTYSLVQALNLINQGYPPPGACVTVKGQEGDFIVVAYYKKQSGTGMAQFGYTGMLLKVLGTGGYLWLDIANTKKVIIPESDFAPKAVSSVSTTLNVPASTAEETIWESFYKKLPFPMTTAMVSAVRRRTKDHVVSGVIGSKQIVGGPAYGTGFIDDEGGKFLAMGFLVLNCEDNIALRFQLAVTTDGDATALSGDPAALAKYKPDFGVTNSFKIPDAWYTHPDPAVNAQIAKLYANGGNLDALTGGVSMKIFKEKWLKEAKIPNYAVASYTIIVEIAALFVPGAATKPQCDAVIGCLKKRMQLTQKKGKESAKEEKPKSVDTVSKAPPVPVAPLKPAAPEPPKKAAFSISVQPENYAGTGMKVIIATIKGDELKVGKGVGGGSKPNYIGTDLQGRKWFMKPSPGPSENFRPFTDAAAFQLCDLVKGNNIPVAVTTWEGKPTSIQPLVEASPVSHGDVEGFSDEDVCEVLSQHAADMFIGDHDGHAGNWLRGKNGKLVSCDHGQAFKFLLTGVEESLMPTWKAPGNFGIHVAKQILIDWSKSERTIPEAAFSAMKLTIDRCAAISDDQIVDIVTTWGKGSGKDTKTILTLVKGLHKRRDGYVKAWTDVMEKLSKARGETWHWPGAPVPVPKKAAKPMAIDKVAEELAFTALEATSIAEAADARWQGKSIQVDKDAIENQEVMVKRVRYSSQNSPEKFATMIHFRLLRSKGLEAEKKLNTKAKVVSGSATGPQPLPFDDSALGSKYWGVIAKGIKTINYHLVGKPGLKDPDGKPNMDTIAAVKTLVPELESLKEQTKDPKGKYQGISHTGVNQMAITYLDYCETILSLAKEAMIGHGMPSLTQFLWQEPVVPEAEEEDDESLSIKKLSKAAFSPSSSPVNNEIAIKGDDAPMHSPHGSGYGKQAQFLIEIKEIPGAKIYFCPPHGESGYVDVRSYYGQAWAVIPGSPTPAQVAILLKAFEKATGLSMSIASDEDKEFLYYSKQAYLLQDLGSGVTPNKEGEAIKDAAFVKARNLYAAGNVDQALDTIKQHVASKLNVSWPDGLKKVAGYNPNHVYNNGVGFGRHYRLGWTREKLLDFLGPEVHFVHATTGDGVLGLMKKMIAHNGALIANVMKPYFGLPIGSTASPDADLISGGAAGLFGCMRKGFVEQKNLMYFDISTFLRTDVYVVGSGDEFGRDTATRFLTPETWKARGMHSSSGHVSISSSNQVCIRHELDIRQYLHTVIFDSVSDRDQIRELCKSAGWLTFANGRPLEKVIVIRKEATP